MLVCMVLLRHKGRLCAAKYLFRAVGAVAACVVRLIASCQALQRKSAPWRSWFLLLRGVGWAAFSSMRAPAFEVHADEVVAPSSSEPEAVEVKAQVYVYVTGAVANPGVYSLDEGLRVCDAVEAAGGLTEDADASTVNLARVLSDGEHIALPTKAEVETALAQGSAGGAAVASSLVNINTADASALETLSGVGSATAQAIISDREQNGPFSTIEDLMRVDGIGEKKFAKLKDSICV